MFPWKYSKTRTRLKTKVSLGSNVFFFHFSNSLILDAGDLNYRILEVKKQHPKNNNLFDYMGVVRVNMVGSLQEARDRFVNNESCFVGKHRFIFMNENLKYVHPKNEESLMVKNLYQNTVLIKVLQPTGKSI